MTCPVHGASRGSLMTFCGFFLLAADDGGCRGDFEKDDQK